MEGSLLEAKGIKVDALFANPEEVKCFTRVIEPEKKSDSPKAKMILSFRVDTFVEIETDDNEKSLCGSLGPQGQFLTTENGDIFEKSSAVNMSRLNQKANEMLNDSSRTDQKEVMQK